MKVSITRQTAAALAALTLALSAGAAPSTRERAGALRAASAQGAQALGPRLGGHIPAAVRRAHLVGRVAGTQPVGLALTLPLRHQAALAELLGRLSTPGDPLYGHFLTPAEFTARFGPTEADYAAVAAAAKSAGLAVTGTHPNRLILDVSGPASTVEAAFGLRLHTYAAADGHLFRAPDAGPRLPGGMAGRVLGVVGLDTAARPHSHLREALARPSVLAGRSGTGPGGGLSPSDVKTAYGLSSPANGAGQTLALYELDGFTASDIAAYEARFGLPAVPLQTILVDGFSGAPGGGADEVTLDIELALALAPSLSKILVYEAPNNNTTQQYLDGYNRIATDNLAKQISTSWGEPESQAAGMLTTGENQIFQQMAAQGQSLFSATGDLGAYDDGAALSVDDPGSQPYVTGVGGTTLTTNGSGGTYASETVWSSPPDLRFITDPTYSAFGNGGGGGFSTLWPAPSYQSNLNPAPAMRSVPDVALNSDPQTGYSIYYAGGWHVYGGTSAAAPLWAGFTALANQGRAALGKPPVGFLNPVLYQIGASAVYGSNFHDITAGTNLYYPAGPGYDNASGWGSFIGSALLSTLVGGLPAAAGTATVMGTITAADTGAALPNVAVSALSSGGAALGTATTSAAGTYTLSVPAGQSVTLSAAAYAATGGAYAGAKAAPAAAAAGGSVAVNFSLRPAHTFGAGLQMISSPYSYTGVGDFAAVFGLSGSSARLVAWNPAALSYVFYPSAPANTLTPGAGYWVNFAAPSYPHFDGALVPAAGPFSVLLSAGWNLIGDPFPAAVPLASVTAGGAPLAASVVSPTLYTYDTPSGRYVAVSAATGTLSPYAGYWVYAARAAELSIPAP